jgi:hypothetical protein
LIVTPSAHSHGTLISVINIVRKHALSLWPLTHPRYRETVVFPVDHGTHVFRWVFTAGSANTPMYVTHSACDS